MRSTYEWHLCIPLFRTVGARFVHLCRKDGNAARSYHARRISTKAGATFRDFASRPARDEYASEPVLQTEADEGPSSMRSGCRPRLRQRGIGRQQQGDAEPRRAHSPPLVGHSVEPRLVAQGVRCREAVASDFPPVVIAHLENEEFMVGIGNALAASLHSHKPD